MITNKSKDDIKCRGVVEKNWLSGRASPVRSANFMSRLAVFCSANKT